MSGLFEIDVSGRSSHSCFTELFCSKKIRLTTFVIFEGREDV